MGLHPSLHLQLGLILFLELLVLLLLRLVLRLVLRQALVVCLSPLHTLLVPAPRGVTCSLLST